VENPDEREFGQEAIIDFIKKNKKLSAYKISEKLFKTINNFSHNKKFRDDFTLIIIKVK
jgi:serine phosphatase RsbU (regulator of sigma subunit)